MMIKKTFLAKDRSRRGNKSLGREIWLIWPWGGLSGAGERMPYCLCGRQGQLFYLLCRYGRERPLPMVTSGHHGCNHG
jgi:hypothetical protein